MSGSLVAAWEAVERGRWDHARRDFESALAVTETAEALEGLGAVAWWLEDVPLMLASRERAYRLFRTRDDRLGAGRMATELGFDYAVFKLEMAVSSGWFQRAHRLLDDQDVVAERVWLALREAELAYHTAGDMDRTRLLAISAKELAGPHRTGRPRDDEPRAGGSGAGGAGASAGWDAPARRGDGGGRLWGHG